MVTHVELTRFSQKALPIAKKYDKNDSGKLEENEYKEFIEIWNKKYGSESPLLMQLHLSSLNEDAKIIAEKYDTDDLKGVLTEVELLNFINEYENSDLKTPFKDGADLYAILRGEEPKKNLIKNYTNKVSRFGLISFVQSGIELFKNLLKRNLMNYKGSDKFFHAVGNYEGLLKGDENSVKKLCDAQDKIKRKSTERTQGDYAEDLYANFLGREFAKIYPNENPHELFAALAPKGFNTEFSAKNVLTMTDKNNKKLFANINEIFKDYNEKIQLALN